MTTRRKTHNHSDDPHDDILHVRVSSTRKRIYTSAAGKAKVSLTAWVIKALDKEAGVKKMVLKLMKEELDK